MIREAILEDTDKLMEIGERAHAASPWSKRIEFDPDSFRVFLHASMASEGSVVLVSAADDDPCEVTGILVGALAPAHWNFSFVSASEQVWYDEAGRGMTTLAAFERWAKNKGAVLAIASMVHNRETVRSREPILNVYRRKGYKIAEQHFAKDI